MKARDIEVIENGGRDWLVGRGADIHARSNSGFTALMFAAQQGDTDSARILLLAGANPNDVTQPADYLVTLDRSTPTLTANLTPVFYDNSIATSALAPERFESRGKQGRKLTNQSSRSGVQRGSTRMVLNEERRTSPGFERGGFETNFF